jgi:hypothetical protein
LALKVLVVEVALAELEALVNLQHQDGVVDLLLVMAA